MKGKNKLFLTIIAALIAVAGIVHSTVRYFALQSNQYSLPAAYAYLWLIPYTVAAIIFFAVGYIIVRKKNKS